MTAAAQRAVQASTRLAAVIGAPVAHSLSPVLHNAAFAAAGIDAVYTALHVEPADLAAAVHGFRAIGLLGASVTVPHKERMVGLCDRVTGMAQDIGAVNCLCFERQGKAVHVVGHNTDAQGFVDSLERDAGRDPKGLRVVLLGAGGAARAVHAGLRAAGAEILAVIARSPQNVPWVAARPWTKEVLGEACRACDAIVDCTSVALSPDTEATIPAEIPVRALPDHALVASLIYHREPVLLQAASARGLATLNGAGMLVYQGARAFESWTGVRAPVTAMWRALRAHLQA